jgi:hydroxyacylglutathione hydrolase
MMKIGIVPCLSDNYAYLVVLPGGDCAIVDPSEAAPVAAAVKREGARPVAIWNTHHHHDHVGGNEELAREFGIADVYGHASDRGRIPGQTKFLAEGDRFALGEASVAILHIPGHTLGAVAYVVTPPAANDEAPLVFTGDTLFVAGCGRLFEGTPEMMFGSLAKLAALPDATRVYCGHEYTEANLRFARHVEPANAAVAAAIDSAKATRARGEPTVPSRIADEKLCNPFVRAKDAAELGARRAAKDVFRG